MNTNENCNTCWIYSLEHEAYVIDLKDESVLKPPFIKNGILNGFSEHHQRPSYELNVALLNKQTMRLLNIEDGDLVRIIEVDIVLRVTCGPVKHQVLSVPPNLMLPRNITLEAFSGSVRSAFCIQYECIPSSIRYALLNSYLAIKFTDSIFVRENSQFNINFLGNIHTIKVTNTYAFCNSNENCHPRLPITPNDETHLSNRLAEININKENARLYCSASKWDISHMSSQKPKLDDIIGYESQLDRIKRYILIPLKYGSKARSVIFYGPVGCGKSFVVKALCNELSQYFPCVWYTDPLDLPIPSCSILVFDPISLHNTSKLIEMFEFHNVVLAIGIANRIDDVPLSLRRIDRFELEIEFPLPSVSERLQFLKANCPYDEDFETIAQMTNSYSFGDIITLIREGETEGLMNALKHVCPSVMQDVVTEVPKVSWSDIGGLDSLKEKLTEMLIWPFLHRQSFERLGITPPRGILLYGPPGCSKTLICRAIANETNLNFISIRGPELFTKWVGDSEKAIRNIFHRAELASPCIIFFDEIDALARERSATKSDSVSDRVVAQMLTEMDGIKGRRSQVLFVAATNRPDFIDAALLRPGRFDRCIYVSLPDAKSRKEIFKLIFRKMPVSSDVCIEELVRRTEMYSGADIVALCNEAGFFAASDEPISERVSTRHFELSFKYVFPRTTKQDLIRFDMFQKKLEH